MSRPIATLAVIASLSLTQIAHADPFLPVPPASFINYHVDTIHQLSQQMIVDAVVRARLAKYFGMTQPNMVSYVQKNLKLSYLKTAGIYRVACITPGGRQYFVQQRLPKGTPVFASILNDKPVLKRACGNPLVSSLPPLSPENVAQQGGNHSEEPAVADAPATTDAPTSTLVASNIIPGDTTLTDVPSLAATDIGELGPITRVAGITQSLGPSLGNGFAIPGILTAVAAVGLLGGGGSSSSSGTPPVVVPPVVVPPINPVPAPEPNASLVYGLGAMGLTTLILRRRAI